MALASNCTVTASMGNSLNYNNKSGCMEVHEKMSLCSLLSVTLANTFMMFIISIASYTLNMTYISYFILFLCLNQDHP